MASTKWLTVGLAAVAVAMVVFKNYRGNEQVGKTTALNKKQPPII